MVVALELLGVHHHITDHDHADGVRRVEDGFWERDLKMFGGPVPEGPLGVQRRGADEQQKEGKKTG